MVVIQAGSYDVLSTPHQLHTCQNSLPHPPDLSSVTISLQQAATLDVFRLVHGAKELDGLIIDQGPEVVKGDVLAALDVHLLKDAVHPSVALRNLQQGPKVRQL